MTLRHDAPTVLDFLRRFHPGRLWALTAIEELPNGRTRAHTRTFDEGSSTEIPAWLVEHAQHNVYHSAAEVLGPVDSKAPKTGIRALHYLHLDIDPRAGAGLAEERERIHKMLLAQGPPPSVIVFSGGGLQAFWRLDQPFIVGGEEARWTEIERYTRRLVQDLDGDPSGFNVDHIMRLPGTVNWPNERKRKKGRVPALAELLQLDSSVHPLTAFRAVEAAPTRGEIVAEAREVTALPEGIPELLAHNIAEGVDPIDTGRFLKADTGEPDRSLLLFNVVRELLGLNIDDPTILGILTNKGWRAGEHVRWREAGARRQLERIRTKITDPDLAALNEEFVLAMVGGRVRVLRTRRVKVPSTRLMAAKTDVQLVESFEKFHCNRKHSWVDDEGNTKTKALGQWWMEHPRRRTADDVVFLPGEEARAGAFNLWHGFAVEPRSGDAKCFLDYTRRRIARGRQDVYDYLINWLALAVQKPGQPGQTVPILFSENTGTGKNAWVDCSLGMIFGHNFQYVNEPEKLMGKFTGHLGETVVLHLGEASISDRAHFEGILKGLSTDRTRMAEKKGLDAFVVENCLHIVFSSNQEWILQVSPTDRRFCVVEVTEEKMPVEEYEELRRRMEDEGGAGHLLDYLLQRDISRFNVFDRPASAAYRRQVAMSRGPFADWVLGLAEDALLPNQTPKGPNVCRARFTDGRQPNGLWEHARQSSPGLRQDSEKKLARMLRDLGVINRKDGDGNSVWHFPPLPEFRAALGKKYSVDEWDETPGWIEDAAARDGRTV